MARREIDEWFWVVGSDLERIGEELMNGRPKLATGKCWVPKVDMIEESRRLIIKAELAGVKGDDISLLYVPERHSLLLRGQRPEQDFSDGSRTGIHQLEILYGEFERDIALPNVTIDSDGIKAQFRNGILLVMIPKRDRAVVTRTVNGQGI
jgi:HSP20 family protein